MARLARLVSLVFTDKTELQLRYGRLPIKYLHSDSQLKYASYFWDGEIEIRDVQPTDIIATMDTYAYRPRHQTTAAIPRIRTGAYEDRITKQMKPLKLSCVIRDDRLHVIVLPVGKNSKVKDIAPFAPLRVSGIVQAHREIDRFSSRKPKEAAA